MHLGEQLKTALFLRRFQGRRCTVRWKRLTLRKVHSQLSLSACKPKSHQKLLPNLTNCWKVDTPILDLGRQSKLLPSLEGKLPSLTSRLFVPMMDWSHTELAFPFVKARRATTRPKTKVEKHRGKCKAFARVYSLGLEIAFFNKKSYVV